MERGVPRRLLLALLAAGVALLPGRGQGGPLPVWTQSLGCPKNMVDTEHVLGSLGIPVKSVDVCVDSVVCNSKGV